MGAAFIAFKVARVLFPWLLSWRNMIPSPPRATIKALPSTPHRPRPYGSPGILPDFPTEVDAYWAHSLRPPGEHPTGPNELRPYAHFPLIEMYWALCLSSWPGDSGGVHLVRNLAGAVEQLLAR